MAFVHRGIGLTRTRTQGAVVANYPWDGNADMATRYEASPDDAAFRHLAGAYAGAHASMAASVEFAGGITNGAAWYPVQQGMQVCSMGLTVRVRVRVRFEVGLPVRSR